MNRRIEGTFADVENLKAMIESLRGQGYVPEQILVLTRNKDGAALLEKETAIEVVISNSQEESLWDKIVSFFMVATDGDDDDDDDREEELFEDYGINEETAERLEDALEDGD